MGTNNIQSSPPFRRICKYDVFISFRGTDTRNGFVDHLYNHLIRKGIFAFEDDERLEKGESISSELIQAIKDSRISVVVFSKGYADSKWCLDEMAMIAECEKKLEQKVFPVFYDVDPSHVRNHNGVYENAFVSHTNDFIENPDKVDRWKSAMKELGSLVGWDIRYKKEFGEIENIVHKVIKELRHKSTGLANNLIGIQPRVEELEKLLKLSPEDEGIRVLGIWGMGGIGKTTLATILYDRISYQFDTCCFVEHVSKTYRDGGAMAIQKQILRQTLDEKSLETYSPFEISGIVTSRLCNLKVLVVLDNVEQSEELEELAIKSLCKSSRIIITTRDVHILKVYEADAIYEVPLLNENDACKLFCRKAFKRDYSADSYMEMIREALKYVAGLPLAIKVLGSFLCARDIAQWRATLDGLQSNPDRKIMEVLRTSVEGLKEEYREIFLHIACFFVGERADYISRILLCCGLPSTIGIPVIIENSLITIRDQEIHMHEMLQELGKKIVQEQFPKNPELWSRLWLYQDFHHVMMSHKGTNNVEAIVLDQKVDISKHIELEAKEFSRMNGLKLLILHHKNFTGSLEFLSNNLRYILWHGYPFTSLASNFRPNELVELNMPNSKIKRLWESTKYLPLLKRIHLSNSKFLLEMPDIEKIPKLERLDLTGCTNLWLVPSSIRRHPNLAFLSLRNCSSLINFNLENSEKCDTAIDMMPTAYGGGDEDLDEPSKSIPSRCRLQVLHLSGCTKLERTDFTELSNLEYLDLEQCTSLSTIHQSIRYLSKLRFLSLRGCTNLVGIRYNINYLGSLITLDLSFCEKLTKLHLSEGMEFVMGSLMFLDLGFCSLSEIPDAIGDYRNLERLNLQGNKFVSLPNFIINLSNLAYLNLAHCHKLQNLPALPCESSSSGGKYFKTTSGSRNHRSGLYIFDCPICLPWSRQNPAWDVFALSWLFRLVLEPCHFRCGFDIVVPGSVLPEWFNYQFKGDSIIRIVDSAAEDNWIGFAFCAAFKANSQPSSVSGSSHHSYSSPLPHAFYLSFETEQAEETFDMPLRLDLDKIDSSEHLWLIYIARPHCHFVKSGAHITFKAHSDLEITKWGLSMVFKQDVEEKMVELSSYQKEVLLTKPEIAPLKIGEGSQANGPPFKYVHESRGSSRPKIQLPYNWLVTDEEEYENVGAKGKEDSLSNVGLTTSPRKRHKASSSSYDADEEE